MIVRAAAIGRKRMHPQLDAVWAVLVFFAQAGFVAREAGVARSKNAVSTSVKLLGGTAVAALAFWAVGYGLAGVDGGFAFSSADPMQAGQFFLVLAMGILSATIVSGAVAERLRIAPYLIFVTFYAAAIFPLFLRWATSGWLAEQHFVDVAGVTWVHSLGGWAAFAALVAVGPRAGRFDAKGKLVRIAGSSVPLTALGVFVLWLGSIGAAAGTAPGGEMVPHVVGDVIIAGAAGGLVALAGGWALRGKPALELTMNGVLAGAISISGAAHAIAFPAALIVGVVGGTVMLLIGALLTRMQIDDVVGAVPVHLGGGLWGTLAVGLFADPAALGTGLGRLGQLRAQAEGLLAAGIGGFVASFALWKLIGLVLPLRVSGADEQAGLDAIEHDAPSHLDDLLDAMEEQARTGDLTIRAAVEPFTETGAIARQYNRVLETVAFSTAKTESLVRTSLDALVTFNTEGIITSSNPAASAIFGYSERELGAAAVTSLFAPRATEAGERVRDDLATLLKLLVGKSREVRGQRRTGEEFPMEASFNYVSVGEDEIYTANIRDITQRKQTEADLNRAQAEIRRRMELELEDAKVVQRALLPTESEFPGCEIARHYQAATETGGDWYGWSHHAETQSITFYMGDVTGHGLPSALMSGVVCGAVYSSELTAGLGAKPIPRVDAERALRNTAEVVNRIVLQTGKGDLLMTMAFLSVDLKSGMVTFLNAGHNMPYLVKSQDETTSVSNLVSRGSRLGESAHPEFEVVKAKLEPGDVIVLYTDGLIENQGPDGKTLSVRDVKQVLTTRRSAIEIRDELVARAHALWADRPLGDDHSILVFRWTPAVISFRRKDAQ